MKEKLIEALQALIINGEVFSQVEPWKAQWKDAYDQSIELLDGISILQIPNVKSPLYDHMINGLYVELYGIKTNVVGSNHHDMCLNQFVSHIRIVEGLVERNFE